MAYRKVAEDFLKAGPWNLREKRRDGAVKDWKLEMTQTERKPPKSALKESKVLQAFWGTWQAMRKKHGRQCLHGQRQPSRVNFVMTCHDPDAKGFPRFREGPAAYLAARA